VVDYLAEIAIDVVDTRLGNEPIAQVATPSKSRSRRVSGFKLFVWNFIRNASVGMPVLLVTLVYLTRARDHLRIEADDRGYERVFLGAFIVASKYTNDSAFRSVRWVLASVLPGEQATLGKRDVNRIEREFLDVLAWKLGFTEENILAHNDAIVSLYRDSPTLPPNAPSSLSRPPSTTVITPPMRHAQSRDTSTPIRTSTAEYDLSTPRILLYPAVLASQPFFSRAGESKHSRPCASDLPSIPLPWRSKNHAERAARRLYV
jgi:hypothetical protein